MSELFPEIEPYRTFRLRVSDLHELHVEETGNPRGKPVVFFHGGPGAGISPMHRRLFDPAVWRVVLFDQRGSGRSTPLGELSENTTWHLVADAERIREELGIEKWLVFGGSWGSTLALAYAEAHPERATGLILRGIYLSREAEIRWTMGGGVQRVYPDGWKEFLSILSGPEKADPLDSYYRRLTSDDPAVRLEASRAWNLWEDRASYLVPQLDPPSEEGAEKDVALSRIEAHYFVNRGFFDPEDQLLRDVGKLRHLPAVIVQGRYDMVCPLTSAWELHEAWPEARFVVVPDAGHAFTEPGIRDALLSALEEFKARV